MRSKADDEKPLPPFPAAFESPRPATGCSGHPIERLPMSSNMYDDTVPALLRGLGVLQSYLHKMQAAVDAAQFNAEELLQARLADDMLPLGRQFQIASDNAKNGPARLVG